MGGKLCYVPSLASYFATLFPLEALTTIGTYVFGSASDNTQQIIVSVLASGLSCPNASPSLEGDGSGGARILAPSTTNLATVGVVREDSLTIEPDWLLIIAALMFMFFLSLCSFSVLRWLRQRTSLTDEEPVPDYWRVGEFGRPPWLQGASTQYPYMTRPGQKDVGSDEDEPSEHLAMHNTMTTAAHPRLLGHQLTYSNVDDKDPTALTTPFMLENFSVKTLFDKLEDQTLHVASQLSRGQIEVQTFHDRVVAHTDELKALLHHKVFAAEEALEENRRARDSERARRSKLAGRFLPVLQQHQALCITSSQKRSGFDGMLRAIRMRLSTLRQLSVQGLRALVASDKPQDAARVEIMIADHAAAINHVKTLLEAEARRRGVYTAVGEATGAVLADRHGKVIPLDVLRDRHGNIGPLEGVVETDDVYGLLFPVPGSKMITAAGKTKPVPPYHMVHPMTGRVVPIHGYAAVTSVGRCLTIGDVNVDVTLAQGGGLPLVVLSDEVSHSLRNRTGPIRPGGEMVDHSSGAWAGFRE